MERRQGPTRSTSITSNITNTTTPSTVGTITTPQISSSIDSTPTVSESSFPTLSSSPTSLRTSSTNLQSTSLSSSSIPVPSTSSTTPFAAASATSLSRNVTVQTTNSKGLIIAVAVLGGLLGIALIAILFLAFRRRKRESNGSYPEAFALKDVAPQDSPGLENTINDLEIQLHERDMQLRDLQATLMEQGQDMDDAGMDDRQVIERFTRLRRTIDDWVQNNFRNMRLDVTLSKDQAIMLQRSQPSYSLMMQDPQMKQLLIRSVVAEKLYQGFTTGELLGIPAFTELNQAIVTNAPLLETNEWRSQTLNLLSKSPSYRTERDSSVSSIAQTIAKATSALAGYTPSSQPPSITESRQQQLSQIVDMAATLALDLARSKTMYRLTWDKVGLVAYDVVNMEDVMGEQGGNARGRVVRMVVFPAVKRVFDAGDGNRGDRDGRSSAMDGRGSAMAGTEMHIVLKELVLVDFTAPGTAR
ncbi:MAG: hypothetical protein MMC33_004586 [Icmadophila ericetorum]|nr:hypothetical protein [Icmadophila ericetorum]